MSPDIARLLRRAALVTSGPRDNVSGKERYLKEWWQRLPRAARAGKRKQLEALVAKAGLPAPPEAQERAKRG